jgi:hypothetical protein
MSAVTPSIPIPASQPPRKRRRGITLGALIGLIAIPWFIYRSIVPTPETKAIDTLYAAYQHIGADAESMQNITDADIMRNALPYIKTDIDNIAAVTGLPSSVATARDTYVAAQRLILASGTACLGPPVDTKACDAMTAHEEALNKASTDLIATMNQYAHDNRFK